MMKQWIMYESGTMKGMRRMKMLSGPEEGQVCHDVSHLQKSQNAEHNIINVTKTQIVHELMYSRLIDR
jgi:hypothetical protein